MATSTLGSGTLVLAGTTSGTTTVTATAVAGTTTLTLPAATDTLVGRATTDTLTNKTLTGAAMNGTVGATTPSTASVTTLTTSSTVTHNGGTANGVGYLDGSKVLTTGSALVFDGTNLGVGVTPSAWRSTFKTLQILGTATLSSNSNTTVYLGSNWYSNSSNQDVYTVTGAAGIYAISAGVHAWYNAPSGTAGNAISFTQAMTLDASGRLGLGTTSPTTPLQIETAAATGVNSIFCTGSTTAFNFWTISNTSGNARIGVDSSSGGALATGSSAYSTVIGSPNATPLHLISNGAVQATIDTSGNLLVGKSGDTLSVVGGVIRAVGSASFTATSNEVLDLNRLSTDGKLQRFYQDTTEEGNISVSGTTVSYNGGHLSRWAQTTAPKDESIVKGTVLSNLDAMNVYTDADGNPVDNEQLNKVKVSDVEGDANVAGVFVNWSHDEDHNVDEINMAMTGDMIIRIAQGVTVARGDLLMSAGDGTAKPQGDDIVRSKTVAKVTSTHITCTYADGSYCVPCVLMAC